MSLSSINGFWNFSASATISENNFVHKSLSNWALNFAIGCGHGCRYCYVPSASVNKQAAKLTDLGITNPDGQWGAYTFLRTWDEAAFLKSLKTAENTPREKLKPDGNRAIMLCSTTDAYQSLRDKNLHAHLRRMVRRSLELIRDNSTLNVRILTRSPLVREDFDLLTTLGDRVMLGMSIPTLRNDLSKIYEPNAPAPTQRLKALHEAYRCGIPTFAAMAPIFPESDEADIGQTLWQIEQSLPLTVFAEPVNIRTQNIERIKTHAESLGVTLCSEVFSTPEAWQNYAIKTLKTVERLAERFHLSDRLHLWPDKALGTGVALKRLPADDRDVHSAWLDKCWSRVSEWPHE